MTSTLQSPNLTSANPRTMHSLSWAPSNPGSRLLSGAPRSAGLASQVKARGEEAKE